MPLASGTVWRTDTDEISGQIRAQVTSADFHFSFLSHTGRVDSIKRMVGCMLLCQLPEPDLDETIHSIHGQLQFYMEDLSLQAPQPIVVESQGYWDGLDEAVEDPALR
jgi:hypothetical protein